MPSVSERLKELQTIQEKARNSLAKNKIATKLQAAKHQTPEPSYKVSDLVWLSTEIFIWMVPKSYNHILLVRFLLK